jgi:sigma-B regulation protein RsbU (phosphoserine phosphatase)
MVDLDVPKKAWTGRSIDLSDDPRLPVLVELAAAVTKARTTAELFGILTAHLRRAFGPRCILTLSVEGLPPGAFRLTRALSLDSVDPIDGDLDDLWEDDGKPIYSAGFLKEIVSTPLPKLYHHLHVCNDVVLGDFLSECRSLQAVPVFFEGRLHGWTMIGSADPEGLGPVDVEHAVLRTNLTWTMAANLRLADRARQAQRALERQVDQIAAIQRSLLPPEIPRITGLDGVVSYNTYDRAGGDYYTLLPLRRVNGEPDPDGPWGIMVADASGHGPAAAVLTAMLHATLLAKPLAGLAPDEVLNYLNRQILSRPIDGSFVTAFYAVYDPSSNLLRYACAGHPPPLLKDVGPEGKVVRLNKGSGLPLGVHDDLGVQEAQHSWNSDQTLILYTDGITDASSPTGETFGVVGIERAAASCAGDPPCVVQAVQAVLREFEAGHRPGDDQTLLVLQRTSGMRRSACPCH